MSIIYIAHLNKVDLLRALWQNSSPAHFFTYMPHMAPHFDECEAITAVKSYIDYFCGRMIKCNLSGDTVDPWQYDMDVGNGAFERVVRGVRRTSQSEGPIWDF